MRNHINSDSLTAEFFTANGAVHNVIVRTSCSTGCINHVLYNNLALGMTKCINGNSLAAEFFAAYGAVNNAIVRTVIYAIGSYFVFYNGSTLGMTKSINGNGRAAEFFTAYGAVYNVIVRTVIYAIGSYFVFYNSSTLGMTKSIGEVGLIEITTNSAQANVIATGGAGGINNTLGRTVGVTESGKLYISGVVAHSTVLICIPTDFGAGRSLCCYVSQSVTQSGNVISNNNVTAYGASISGVTNLCAGRSSYNRIVAVTKCRHNIGSVRSTTTVCTGVQGIAVISAGGSNDYGSIIVSIGINRNHFRNCDNRIAQCAGQLTCPTGGNTGCGNLALGDNGNVTEIARGYDHSVTRELVATNGAVYNFVVRTVLLASRSLVVFNNRCTKSVTEFRNYDLRNENFTANIAVRAFGQTSIYTIGINCGIDHFRMAESVNIIVNISITANRALVGGVTNLSASRSSNNCIVLVSKCRSGLSSELIAANLTPVMLDFRSVAGRRGYGYDIIMLSSRNNNVRAGKLFAAIKAVNYKVVRTFNFTPGSNFVFLNCFGRSVTQSGNGILRGLNIAATIAMRTLSQAGIITVGSNCGISHIVVTESISVITNLNVAANGTGISGVACLGASGSSNNCVFAVSESGHIIANPLLAAMILGTSVGGVTRLSTSRSSYSTIEPFVVALSGCLDHRIVSAALITNHHVISYGYAGRINVLFPLAGACVSVALTLVNNRNHAMMFSMGVGILCKHEYRHCGKDKCTY